MFGAGMMTMIDTEIWYLFGISAIGAASIAYILFGFSSDNKKKSYIQGLRNVRNNCFINSILQSFASSDSMVNWLNQCAMNSESENDSNLIKQLSYIVDRINNKIDCDKSELLSPEGVLDSLRKHRWMFSTDEQDAFELFSVLLSTLDIESNQLSLALSIRDSLNSNKCDIKNDELINKNRIRIGSKIQNSIKSINQITSRKAKNMLPTRGILSSHLKCQHCNRKYPMHLDIFDSISLSLPSTTSIKFEESIALETCLNLFTCEEKIDDFHCQYCNQKCTFIKQIELIKLPRLLCFHVHRLVWSNGNQTKRADHIKFPEILIMDPFKNNSLKLKKDRQETIKPSSSSSGDDESKIREGISAQYIYILNSVIVHLGNYHSGHFVCYRRSKSPYLSNQNHNQSKCKWYYTSDLVIKEVNKKEVFASCAYMLFYEKIKKESNSV